MFIVLTFIGFTALVAIISWYRTRNDNLDTQEGYFLAGRGLSGLVIAGSLELTNLSTEQLVGQSGQSYATNMGAMNWSVSASFALLCLAMIFLPRYLKAGITTIPEFLEQRYDTTVKRIISFLFLLGYLLTYLPTVLYSGALAFNRIFNLDELLGLSQFTTIALLCFGIGLIGAIYAIFGGLKAVAVSDTINGIGLLVGGFLVPILAVCILGNEGRDFHRIPQAGRSLLYHHLRSACLPLLWGFPDGEYRRSISHAGRPCNPKGAARVLCSRAVWSNPVLLQFSAEQLRHPVYA